MKSKTTVMLWMIYDLFTYALSLVFAALVAVNFKTEAWMSLMRNPLTFMYYVLVAAVPNILFLYFTKKSIKEF